MKNRYIKKGVTAFYLKMVAIIAMTIDHITWAFLRSYTDENFYIFVIYEILRGIGRLTMPIMCMLIVDGFFYTHNFKKYLFRLLIFSIISHFAYEFFETGSFLFLKTGRPFYSFQTSIIFNLFLCLLGLSVLHSRNINFILKFFIFIFLFIFAWFCDWRFLPLMLTILFYTFYKRRYIAIILYLPLVCLWFFIHHWCGYFMLLLERGKKFLFAFQNALPVLINDLEKTFPYKMFFLGLIFVIPFFCMYNGHAGGFKKGSILGLFSKWFFYIYYPLHLVVLGFLKYGYF